MDTKALMRQRLLAAAQAILATKPLSAISMDDIAREARMAKGTCYIYFESKDALLEALVDECARKTAEEVASLEESFVPVPGRLEVAIVRALGMLVRHAYALEIRPDVLGRPGPFTELLQAWFEEGERRKELCAVDARWTAVFVASSIDRAARLMVSKPFSGSAGSSIPVLLHFVRRSLERDRPTVGPEGGAPPNPRNRLPLRFRNVRYGSGARPKSRARTD